MAKYIFTPHIDREILYTYSINTDSKPRVINLAKKFNMPRWAVYQRALKIGAVMSSHQKKPWVDVKDCTKFGPIAHQHQENDPKLNLPENF